MHELNRAKAQLWRRLLCRSVAVTAAYSCAIAVAFGEDPKKSLDDKLFEKLAPSVKTEAEPVGPDALDRTVKSMRQVGENLGKKGVTDETVSLQKSIISDIDALIEKLKQPPPPKDQSSSSDSSDQNKDQQQNQGQSQSERQQKSQSQQKPTEGGRSTRPQQQLPSPDQKSSESTDKERQRKLNERAAELARRRALINEVWGHLPPNVREKLLNVSGDKMLPQYEELIRKYYEVLAEPTDAPLRSSRPNNDRNR